MGKKNNVKKRGGNNSEGEPPKPIPVQENPKPPGIISRILSILYTIIFVIIGGVVIANILAVLMMCGVIYMMTHFLLLMINGIIKLIRSIFPFLKKKLKPIKVWPHELILDALGIKYDSDDPYSTIVSSDDKDKDGYCPSK